MSQGMHNLIGMTQAANKTSRLFLHVGYNDHDKSVKMTSDKDCLPPDITYYRTAEFTGMDDLKSKVKELEKYYTVCIDTEYYFYETEVNKY
jgi:hypothetical protein